MGLGRRPGGRRERAVRSVFQRSVRSRFLTGAMALLLGIAIPVPFARVQPLALADAPRTWTVCASGCDATTIAAALVSASSGDTISVSDGSYAESVTIDKAITLRGAKAGFPGAGRLAVGGESVIVGQSAGGEAAITIVAAGVTVEGLWVTNVASPGASLTGIRVKGSASGAVVRENVVAGLDGPTCTDSNQNCIAQAIYLEDGPSHVRVVDNRVSAVSSGRAAKGVYLGYMVDGLLASDITVEGNLVTDVSSGTKGGYGLLVGYKPGVDGLVVRGNTFASIRSGTGWVHAIGIESTAASLIVEHNRIRDLVTPSADKVGLLFEKDTSAGTSLIRYNDFSTGGSSLAISMANDYAVGTVTASYAWWGQASGAAAGQLGQVGSFVTSPWIASYLDDPAKAGAPGFWPIGIAPRTALSDGTAATLVLDAPELGSPVLTIAGSTAGAVVSVSEGTNPSGAATTPFVVSGGTLIDIAAPGTTGPYTVCIDGSAPQRLWHYESGAWVDITDRVIAPALAIVGVVGKLCGMTSSLSPFAVAVPKTATTTLLLSSANPATFGSGVTFTVSVTTGTTAVTDGTISLSDGSDALGSPCALAGTTSCSFGPFTDLTVGTHAIRAYYGGTSLLEASAATIAQVIVPATTVVTYTGSTYDDDVDGGVDLSAGIAGCPVGGIVTFTVRDAVSDAAVTDGTTATSGPGPVGLRLSLTDGLYVVLVSFTTGDSACVGGSDESLLAVVVPGRDAAHGGGYYHVNGSGLSGNPRVDFAFRVSWVQTGRNAYSYKGALAWTNKRQTRLKADLTSTSTSTYGLFRCPQSVGNVATCASISGSGVLEDWIGNRWVPRAGLYAFVATVYDGGEAMECKGTGRTKLCTKKARPDWFGIDFRMLTSSQIRESLPVELRGGSLVVY